VPATPAETDPSVCYRHPDRTSWTLCTRCGRTICPECQILTPNGVQCPDCVRETGGSVRWESTAAKPAQKKTGMRRQPRRGSLLQRADASTLPVATIAIAAITLVLWILGFLTANAPFTFLAALPDVAWQVWRYATAAFAYPAVGAGVVFSVLSIAIFVFLSWGAERQFGRSRFLLLFFVTGIGAAAISLLAGGYAFGLIGAIWGLTGAYVIVVWQHVAVRNRLLITVAVWLLISLFLGGNILALIGGALSGIGAMLLLRRFDDRPSVRPSTPYLILAGGLAVLIVLAILRNTVLA
jgi:membrane associated rhomboid family serine protease